MSERVRTENWYGREPLKKGPERRRYLLLLAGSLVGFWLSWALLVNAIRDPGEVVRWVILGVWLAAYIALLRFSWRRYRRDFPTHPDAADSSEPHRPGRDGSSPPRA